MTKEDYLKVVYSYPMSIEWTTGGSSGGDCWGGTAREFTDDSGPPEFDSLSNILQELCPTITLAEFRMIEKDKNVFKHRLWTDYEYYGNRYDRESYTIDEDALWLYAEILTNIPDPAVRASLYALMKD
jgi:hypothetical protein